jgi:hypothetical protein
MKRAWTVSAGALTCLAIAVLLLGGVALAQAQDEGTFIAGANLLEADPRLLAEALVTAIADEIRREWSVKCDAANFNIYDSDQAHGIQITVSNSGACPFKLTVTKADATTEDFTIQPGTPSTINRTNVKKITVDCDGPAASDCKASYTLKEDGAAAPADM